MHSMHAFYRNAFRYLQRDTDQRWHATLDSTSRNVLGPAASRFGAQVTYLCSPAVRKQLADQAGPLRWQPLKHVAQVGIAIMAFHGCRLDKARDRCSLLACAQVG